LRIENKEICEIWGGYDSVNITSVGTFEDAPDIWQARFEVVNASASKSVYLDKLVNKLRSMGVTGVIEKKAKSEGVGHTPKKVVGNTKAAGPTG